MGATPAPAGRTVNRMHMDPQDSVAHEVSRRRFLGRSTLATLLLARPFGDGTGLASEAEAVIDIHQHTNYSDRTNAQLVAHQRAIGVTKTILLPAGRKFGLDAKCGGNQTVLDLARAYPGEFVFFANEVSDLSEARSEIERYLKLGAIGIGEQKFMIESDSTYLQNLADLAREYRVPVLMHFQFGTYNTSIERFHRVLERYPDVNFIGHAQTWWGNIDRKHDQPVLYPTGKVTPGGITDRLMTDYPNMYGDMSAGSGLNALLRDEEHATEFMRRHQDRLLFGTDCNDTLGRGPGCQGAQTLASIRRLAPSKAVERKLLYENSKRLFRL